MPLSSVQPPNGSHPIPDKVQGLAMAYEALYGAAPSSSLTSFTVTLPPDSLESCCVSSILP